MVTECQVEVKVLSTGKKKRGRVIEHKRGGEILNTNIRVEGGRITECKAETMIRVSKHKYLVYRFSM